VSRLNRFIYALRMKPETPSNNGKEVPDFLVADTQIVSSYRTSVVGVI
jgi:hypothetical protein